MVRVATQKDVADWVDAMEGNDKKEGLHTANRVAANVSVAIASSAGAATLAGYMRIPPLQWGFAAGVFALALYLGLRNWPPNRE